MTDHELVETRPFSRAKSRAHARISNLERELWATFVGRRRAHLWLALGAALILVGLHAVHTLDNDEGVVLNGAWNVLNGRVPYTDFFEYVAPGNFYLVAAVWKLTGAYFWVAKGLAILAIGAAAIGVLATSRLLLASMRVEVAPWFLAFGPLIFLLSTGYWPAINHNTFGTALIVWSTFLATRCVIRGSQLDPFFAGLVCGLAALFLPDRAALVGVTIVVLYLFLEDRAGGWKRAAAFGGAAALPVLGLLLVWSPQVLYEQLILFPANGDLETNRIDPGLFFFVATVLLCGLWLLRNQREPAVGFLLALQIVLFASAVHRPDEMHISSTLFPILALVPHMLRAAGTGTGSTRTLGALVIVGLLLMNAQVPILVAAKLLQPWFYATPDHPAVQFVRHNCAAKRLYAGPSMPGVYFETGQLNPSRYSILLTRFNTDVQFAEALAELKARRPGCVLTNYSGVEKFGHDRRNVVDDFIQANFDPVYRSGRLQVWAPRGTARPPR